MKESEKIYQIKTVGFENGKKVEKAVCINNDDFLRKDKYGLYVNSENYSESKTNPHTFDPNFK